MPEITPALNHPPVRLVVFEERPENTEWLISALRGAGIPSRVHIGKNESEASSYVAAHAADLVVWGQGHSFVSLAQACQLAEAADVPLLIAADTLDAQEFERWRLGGANDVYLRGNVRLAQKIVHDWFCRSQEHQWAARARQDQEQSTRSSEALLEAIGDPVAYLNEGMHIKANAPYLELLGMENFEELEGLSLLDVVSKEDSAVVKEKIKKLGRGQGEPEEISVTLERAGQVTFTFSPSHFDGEPCLLVSVRQASPVAQVVGSATAGIASAIAPPNLEQWLRRDTPTGLYNRQHFLNVLETRNSGSVWLVQVDRQDQVLSLLGATQLDALVGALGKSIEKLAVPDSLVARWTAGTVAVIAPLEDEAALGWAQSLRATLGKDMLEVGARSLPISVSMVGLALVETMAVDERLAMLEQGFKEVLERQKGLRYLDPRAEEKARARLVEARVSSLKEAISAERLVLWFQPIASLVESSARYEVLVRLKRDDGTLEEPSEFMPLAEKHGVAADIDAWVVGKALAGVAHKQKTGEAVQVVLKVSVSSLQKPAFLERLEHCLEETQVEPSRVSLEVSVATATTHAKEVLELRKAADRLGVQLVLSGVTADEAVLRLVDMVSPQWVKLAREITMGLGVSNDKQALLKTVLNHVQPQEIKVIAGFIQDPGTMTVLFSAGVEALQGQFLSPPQPTMNFDFSQMGF